LSDSTLALTATLAMLVQQTFATYARGVVPVLAPAIGADLDLDPSHAGTYAALASAAAMAGSVAIATPLRRWGGFRVAQAALALAGLGLAIGAPGGVGSIAFGALLVGVGSVVSTPASSHVLARVVPLAQQPLYFSIKQTGVPLGAALTGLLGPAFTEAAGWRGALMLSGLVCAGLAVALQPWRLRFDADRDPTAPLRLTAFGETLLMVWTPALAPISGMAVVYVGLQIVHMTFAVVYLVDVQERSLAGAGALFSLATLIAIPGRVFWGWLGGRLVPTRIVLSGIGLGTAAAFGALAALPRSASDGAILAALLLGSATVMAFHGLMLAELARLAPAGRAGAATGAVLFFVQIGQIVLPALFGLFAAAVGYRAAWAAFAAPALVMAGWLAWRRA